jgi:hypothetical protein
MAKAFYAVGFWIRETGQALDRLGCRLQGNYFFHEQSKNQQLPATRITLPFSPWFVDFCRYSEHGVDLLFSGDPKGVRKSGLSPRVRDVLGHGTATCPII